ncbi:MAG: hypothetical protein LBO68_02630 [Synergistaceae bacterium]|jgi:hypothetical protein|nr:hypothetical protein [Synergistaceae bacterium]
MKISTKTITKIFAAAIGAFLLAGIPAQAKMQNVILEVTGTLKAIDETVTPNEIVLQVEGKDAAGPLASTCRFLDGRGRDMEQRVFARNYLKKTIVVELIEHTGEVVSCKPAF